jgi:hypothetical protein
MGPFSEPLSRAFSLSNKPILIKKLCGCFVMARQGIWQRADLANSRAVWALGSMGDVAKTDSAFVFGGRAAVKR